MFNIIYFPISEKKHYSKFVTICYPCDSTIYELGGYALEMSALAELTLRRYGRQHLLI